MVSIIAAIGKNNELGLNNNLIWHLSGDMKFFKTVTTGKTDKPNAPELKAGERSTGPVYQGWYT